MPQRQLGELMTELGLIDEEQLAAVLEVQQRSKRPLGQIIVELGFASGAAVAHALAMQSGGALRTEYGFALGVLPEEKDSDSDETGAGLPKLRLAPTASAPPARADIGSVEEQETADVPSEPADDQAASVGALPDPEEESTEVERAEHPEEIDEVDEADEAQPVDAVEHAAAAAPVEIAPEIEEPEIPLVVDPEPEPAALDELPAEVERLEAALAEAQTTAAGEQERLEAALVSLEATLAETLVEREQEIARLREEHGHATAELERLESTLADAGTETEQELSRLREEKETATAETERLQATLTDTQSELHELESRFGHAQERHSAERDELSAQRDELASQRYELRTQYEELTAEHDRIQAELAASLERLATVGSAAEERDELRSEVERLRTVLGEAQETAAGERDRLLADVARLESALAEASAVHAQELGRLRDEHEQSRSELDHLHTALAEAQISATEHARQGAEDQERLAAERAELVDQRDRLQGELGETLDRLATLGPAAEERDYLRAEVDRLESSLTEVQESCAVELRGANEDRDRLTAELTEAKEMLRQAERLRESQIALTAERDRAITDLGRVQTAAAEAQAMVEEQTRLLADEQDRRHSERETLLAQRTLLEQELGAAIEQLAAAAAAADERDAQLQLGSERLVEALDAVRQIAAELVSPDDEMLAEPEATDEAPGVEAPPETDQPEDEAAAVESDQARAESEPEEIEYSLFVPGPNGYDLVPQSGVPPQAGETIELVPADREEPTLFEVVRSGRTMPGGDVCVYLSQV
jgi:chromosome segregation ATPase